MNKLRLFSIILLSSSLLFSACTSAGPETSSPDQAAATINPVDYPTLSAVELASKKQTALSTDYASLITDYDSAGSLTPSKKVKITSFDLGKTSVQVDYSVATSLPVYIGYSFADQPVPEETAWQVTGLTKPTSPATTTPGVMNRTVYVWENLPELKPFAMVQAIYEADGRVGKIAVSKENLETALSEKSLYFVK